jgi:hypothetical protein
VRITAINNQLTAFKEDYKKKTFGSYIQYGTATRACYGALRKQQSISKVVVYRRWKCLITPYIHLEQGALSLLCSAAFSFLWMSLSPLVDGFY